MGDADLDLDDFVILQNFATTSVVEPATASLMALSGLALLRRRRRCA